MTQTVRTAVLCGLAFGLGAASHAAGLLSASTASDDKQPPAFLSGGARSEKVLKEILSTIQKMDERVESIEGLLRNSAGSSSSPRRDSRRP